MIPLIQTLVLCSPFMETEARKEKSKRCGEIVLVFEPRFSQVQFHSVLEELRANQSEAAKLLKAKLALKWSGASFGDG